MQTLICGASKGRCELRTIAADVPLGSIGKTLPQCLLRLAPDDEFSCSASLGQAQIDASLGAVANGTPVTAVASANCAVTSPPPDECAGMIPGSIGEGIAGDAARTDRPSRHLRRHRSDRRRREFRAGGPGHA